MQLVNEGDDLPVRAGDLGQDRLEAFLELAAILRTGNHRRHVEGHQALVAQGLRDIARDDALGEAFDDGGLTDAGFTDQDGVVLRTPGQDLDDATNLVVTPNDRIELAFARHLGQVATVLGQSLERPFGVRRGDRVRTQLGERLRQSLSRRTTGGENTPRLGIGRCQSDEQVLGRNVLVSRALGALPRILNGGEQRARGLSGTRGCPLSTG